MHVLSQNGLFITPKMFCIDKAAVRDASLSHNEHADLFKILATQLYVTK